MKRIIIFSISILLLPMLSFAAATTDRTKYCYMYGTFDGNYSSIGNAQAQCFTVQSECQNSKKNIDFTAGGVISVDGNDCTLNQTGFVGQTAVETGTSYDAYGETTSPQGQTVSSNSNTSQNNNFSLYGTSDSSTRGDTNNSSLSGLPGFEYSVAQKDFSGLINTIYKLAIGIGSIMAVFMIIWAGVQYMTSTNASNMQGLKEKILGALGGLVFLLAAFALLSLINSKITSLSVSELDKASLGVADEEGGFTFTNDGDDTAEPTPLDNDDPSVLLNPTLGDGSLLDNNDTEIENDRIGTIYDEIAGGGWIGDTRDPSTQVPFPTQDACEEAKGPGSKCYKNTDVATPTTEAPSVSGTILTMSSRDNNYDKRLTPAQAAKIGWPVNPYRRPLDFASKGNRQIRISRTAVEMDKYWNDQYKSRFGITLRLVSAYRDPAHNKCTKKCNGKCCSTSNNHQLGYSLDYSTKTMTQAQLNFMQDLIITSKVVRVGWGKTNNAGTHVQWDDGVNNKYVYWCYQSGYHPHKGKFTMPHTNRSNRGPFNEKNWKRGSSCSG